jgi:hypothetical protein
VESSLSKFCFKSGVVLLLASCCMVASAHHSFTRFDASRIVEIEGEIVSFKWRNPHIRFKIRQTTDDGEEIVWDLEGHSLSILRRTDASPEDLKSGDRVRIAGWPTVRQSTEMFVHNLMMPDGRELVFGPNAKPRWTDENAIGAETQWLTAGTAGESGRNALFRVWSTYLGAGGSFFDFWKRDYPLTSAGQARFEQFDPVTDTTSPGCEPKGMPLIMEQPYPVQFVPSDDDILIRLEEFDTVRTIHMDRASTAPDTERSLLGYSRGHWEQNTLVIETSGVDYRYFNPQGVPQGSNPSYIEKFRVSDDGSRLEYELTATDTEVFTEPVSVSRDWVWRPGEQVRPYECDSE